MEYKEGAPDGEVPPTHCPVCLEGWNSEDRLPKFLSCHHSVCITCAGRLQRSAPASSAARRSAHPSTPTSPLARLMGTRVVPLTVPESTKCDETFLVRCPLCRTSTQVQDPATLQTNFYLRGLLRAPSLPRLVLWCESCCRVATPECCDHHLRPFPEKLRLLQEELVERAEEAKRWTRGRAGEYRRQVEVYRWLCGLLRHAHARVLDSLTHAQHNHRRLHHHSQDLQALVTRGEALQRSREPEEDVVVQLVRAAEEVDERHRAVAGEADALELLRKFTIMSTHRGPPGYSRARVVLEAVDTVSLLFFGEEECEDEETDMGRCRDGNRSMRSNSLSECSRRKASARQMARSRSLLQAKGKTEHLFDAGSANDNLASRTSTPVSRQSMVGVSDVNSVYEEETSIAVPSLVASTPPISLKKKSCMKTEKGSSSSGIPSALYHENVRDRRRNFEDDCAQPRRPRGQRTRRPVDRQNRLATGHRRSRRARCSIM